MKRTVFITSVILVVACLFASCSSCAKTVKLEPKQDGYYNEELKVYYTMAPSTYEAVGYIKEAYAKDPHGFTFHIVTDPSGKRADPSEWLYDFTNAALLYNSDKKLPSLEEMAPTCVDFFAEGNTRVNLHSTTASEEITKILECLDNPSCSKSSIRSELYDWYGLRFTSASHIYIAYILDYVEFTSNIYEYEKAEGYTDIADVEARHNFRDGVEHEIIAEDDGSFTVKYNYGKYFVYDEVAGRYYMAQYIHDTYKSGESK